jgi:hypothetical protein
VARRDYEDGQALDELVGRLSMTCGLEIDHQAQSVFQRKSAVLHPLWSDDAVWVPPPTRLSREVTVLSRLPDFYNLFPC